MNAIRIIHRDAMKFAQEAFLAKEKGEKSIAEELFRKAFNLELQAAKAVEMQIDKEPSRSVLHRSAAALALECGELRESERLISIALSGNPPEEIAVELRNLLERVFFERYLQLEGKSLASNEIQISISGKGVSHGLVESSEVTDRIDNIQKLTNRIAERKLGQKYRERGPIPKKIKSEFKYFLSAAQAASFSLTLRIAGSLNEPTLKYDDFTEETIGELCESLSLFNEEKYEAIKNIINDESYYRNFIGLAKEISPDGQNVNQVGITISQKGQIRTVGLTRPRNKISMPTILENDTDAYKERDSYTFEGVLLYADSIKDRDIVQLELDSEKLIKIKVPSGMMADVVKPHFGDKVKVECKKVKKNYLLIDFEKIKQ